MDTRPVAELLGTFRAQGVEAVFVALCCDRVYVGREKAKVCSTCSATPANQLIRTDGTDLMKLQGAPRTG